MDGNTKTDYLIEFHKSQIELLRRKKNGQEEDCRPLKQKIKEVVVEVAEFSLFAGISNIFRSDWYVRVTWMLAQLTLLSIVTYLVYNNISTYLKYEVTTRVRELNTFPAYFPTVTLCNMNYFQTNYSVNFLVNVGATYNMPDIFSVAYNGSDYDYWVQEYAFIGSASVLQNNLNKTEIEKLGYSLDDMLLTCMFSSEQCNNSDFEWFFHPLYGNCYKFNSGRDINDNPIEAKTVLQTGTSGGLILEMFVGIPSSLEVLTNDFGLAVFVHPNTTSPVSVQPVTLNPNEETNIVVSMVKTEKQPQPYSDCQDLNKVNSDLKEIILKKGIDYYQQDCILQCYQKEVIKNCSCYDLNFVCYFDNVSPCINTNMTQYDCYSPIYSIFLSASFIETNCLPSCPLECNSSIYYTSLSSNGYPTTHYETYLLKSSTQVYNLYNSSNYSQALRYNILKLNVYFDSLSYTEIEEVPATDIITLMSDVGGSIGLLLGISLATLVELIELSIKILFVVMQHKKQKHKVFQSKTAN